MFEKCKEILSCKDMVSFAKILSCKGFIKEAFSELKIAEKSLHENNKQSVPKTKSTKR